MNDVELEELLRRCATEPIHTPGATQDHGVLIVVDPDGRVVAVSANAEPVLGVAADAALGQTVGGALGDEWPAVLAEALASDGTVVRRTDDLLACTATRSGEFVMLEIEPEPDDRLGDGWRLQHTIQGLMGAPDSDALIDQVVSTVAELTGFERVMCYRFDEEWNGEVVAERIADGVESFDGLRFPATDIPAQARAQYERTPLRLIPDSLARPVPLLATTAVDADTLDLSDARLRAVSPIHLRYLQNLGVRSSMSVSLTVDGKLWGIVACHHVSEPLRPSRRTRVFVDLVARTASMLLTVLETARASNERLELVQRLDELTAELVRADVRTPLASLGAAGNDLADLVGATGVALALGSWSQTLGTVPPEPLLDELLDHCRSHGGPFASSELGLLGGGWAEATGVPAGALVVPVGASGEQWIAWFRQEQVEMVRWAGDPNAKVLDVGSDGLARLGPRTSFASYAETVRGRSIRWTEHEVNAAVQLAARIVDADAVRAARDARLAAQLQQTLLLEVFPDIDGVDGAAEYRPESNSPLGGDWYDVFYLPSGGSIVALGDVAGHGLEVAGVMAQLRHALRAYLVRAPSTDVALSRLNELMRALLPTEMATVVLAEIDADRRTVRVANAGHLPPVIAGPTGARLVENGGAALGLLEDARYPLEEAVLAPGERLILYSDGLIERRTRLLDDSIQALADAAVETVGLPLADQCRALADRLTEGSDVNDDVTVVIVEVPTPDRSAPVLTGPGLRASPPSIAEP